MVIINNYYQNVGLVSLSEQILSWHIHIDILMNLTFNNYYSCANQ